MVPPYLPPPPPLVLPSVVCPWASVVPPRVALLCAFLPTPPVPPPNLTAAAEVGLDAGELDAAVGLETAMGQEAAVMELDEAMF